MTAMDGKVQIQKSTLVLFEISSLEKMTFLLSLFQRLTEEV